MNNQTKSKLMLITAMTAFGTIGIFRRYVPLPSGLMSCFRGISGALFLVLVVLISKQGFSFKRVKNNLVLLIVSGGLIGFNWIFLFEAYNYTSVSVATLCYYMSPTIVVLLSPLFLKERLTAKKLICVAISLTGMILVSGVLNSEFSFKTDLKGILLGLAASVMYASVVLINKKIKSITAYEKTIVQLFSAGVVVLPYTMLAETVKVESFTPLSIGMLLFMGIFHTGVCYALYFGSMDNIKAQTIAILSYIDPVVALLLSALVLHERMGVIGITGSVLILGSTLFSEIEIGQKKKQGKIL